MKFKLVLMWAILATGMTARANPGDVTVAGEDIPLSPAVQLGYGYDVTAKKRTDGACVTGTVESHVYDKKMEAFENPKVTAEVPFVTINFIAYSTYRRGIYLNGPLKFEKAAQDSLICKSGYVSKKEVAGFVRMSVYFFVGTDEGKANLIAKLGQVKDLAAMKEFNYSDPTLGILGWGMNSSASGNVAEVYPLKFAMEDCGGPFYQCPGIIDAGYAMAAGLDQRYTIDRVSKLVDLGNADADFGTATEVVLTK